MSAMKAIRARGIAAFAETIDEARKARGWDYEELARQAFGVNDKGNPINGSYTHTILTKRRSKPHDQTVAQLARALDLDPARLIALRDSKTPSEMPVPAPAPTHAPRAPRAHAVLPPPREDAVPFLLSIQADGTATLRLNMVQVPAERAFRAMAALTAAGLLPTGAEGVSS